MPAEFWESCKRETLSAQSKRRGTGEKLRYFGLSLARSLQEEPNTGSFRALLSVSRCSGERGHPLSEGNAAFLLSNDISFPLLLCSLPFSAPPRPNGHHSSIHLPSGMPGQALIEFLRSGCERGVRVSNIRSDFAGKELVSIPRAPLLSRTQPSACFSQSP